MFCDPLCQGYLHFAGEVISWHTYAPIMYMELAMMGPKRPDGNKIALTELAECRVMNSAIKGDQFVWHTHYYACESPPIHIDTLKDAF